MESESIARSTPYGFGAYSLRDRPFRVTPGLLLAGLIFAVVMGVLGGFFPAWRASKVPVVQAIR